MTTVRRLGVALTLLAALVLAGCEQAVIGGPQTGNVQTVGRLGQAHGRAERSRTGRSTSTSRRSRDFEDATGVTVKYIEDVNDNAEFFGKVQPQLDQGESGGRSIFVVTDWMANKMHELGYLQNFDKTAMPNNYKNLVPSLANPLRSTPTATTRCRGRPG